MLQKEPLLVIFLKMVDRIPIPEQPQKRKRGRPYVYSDSLMVKALIIMIVKRLYSAYSLLAFLEQGTMVTEQLKEMLQENGQFPSRRTWERRLARLPERLPGLIGALGRELVCLLQPWATSGRAVAIDSTPMEARGGVWHTKDREKGLVPHTSIDTEAHWGRSDYHGWYYGWKLHLTVTVAAIWIPLSARLTPANIYDGNEAIALLEEISPEARFVLGDNHYKTPDILAYCQTNDRFLVASGRGPYPHDDLGVKVRQIFHLLRSKTIEPFNQLFKSVFDLHENVPVKGLQRTSLILLAAVFLYQIVLLYQFENGLPIGRGIKPLLRAA